MLREWTPALLSQPAEQGGMSVVTALGRWRLEYQFKASLGSLRSSQNTKASRQDPLPVRKRIERLFRHPIYIHLVGKHLEADWKLGKEWAGLVNNKCCLSMGQLFGGVFPKSSFIDISSQVGQGPQKGIFQTGSFRLSEQECQGLNPELVKGRVHPARTRYTICFLARVPQSSPGSH